MKKPIASATLLFERETKRTYLFKQDLRVGFVDTVTSIYINKMAFDGKPPPRIIELTIEGVYGKDEK